MIALAKILPSPAEDVRCLAGNIHEMTDRFEYGANYFLDEIEAKNDRGWSAQTLLAIFLANDAQKLREIADRIDTIRQQLTTENRQ